MISDEQLVKFIHSGYPIWRKNFDNVAVANVMLNNLLDEDFFNVGKRIFYMEWKNIKDELPPIGKRIVITRPGSQTLGICQLLYTFLHEEDRERNFTVGGTKEMIQCASSYWLEIPELPKDKS